MPHTASPIYIHRIRSRRPNPNYPYSQLVTPAAIIRHLFIRDFLPVYRLKSAFAKTSCIRLPQHRQAWFTYSYCHNVHVRQFRELTATHHHTTGKEPPDSRQNLPVLIYYFLLLLKHPVWSHFTYPCYGT